VQTTRARRIGALPPSEVLTLLRRRLDRLAEQRTEIRTLIDDSLGKGVPGLFLVEEEYRLTLLEAESSFVERFIEQITDRQTGWSLVWAEFHGEPAPNDERRQPSPTPARLWSSAAGSPAR
jgi:hypothetical protein